jgi:hypothetical protein
VARGEVLFGAEELARAVAPLEERRAHVRDYARGARGSEKGMNGRGASHGCRLKMISFAVKGWRQAEH